MHRNLVLLSGLCLPLWLASPSISHANTITPTWDAGTRSKLAQGEPVIFHPAVPAPSGARLAGAIHVNAKRQDVWRVLTTPTDQPKFLKNLKSSELVKATSRSQLIAHTIKLSFLPLNLSYRYMARHTSDRRRIRFKMLDGDLRKFEGQWHIMDGPSVDGRAGSVVFYELFIDPGKLIPPKMLRKNLQKDLPNMLQLMRKRVYAVRTEA